MNDYMRAAATLRTACPQLAALRAEEDLAAFLEQFIADFAPQSLPSSEAADLFVTGLLFELGADQGKPLPVSLTGLQDAAQLAFADLGVLLEV